MEDSGVWKTFEEAYRDDSIRRRVVRAIQVSVSRGWFGPRVDLEDLEAETWSRAWQYWDQISQSSKPGVSLVMKGREVVQAWRDKYIGRDVKTRGKIRRWGGTWGQAGMFTDECEHRGLTYSELYQFDPVEALVGTSSSAGRSQPLVAASRAVLFEELDRVGFDPSMFFTAKDWNQRAGKERHFVDSDWRERLTYV